MSKFSFRDQVKMNMQEAEYLKGLTKEEKKEYKSLTKEEKQDMILERLKENESGDQPNKKIERWLNNKGISNPSDVTVNAIEPLVSDSRLSSLTNTWATITTLSVDKQAIMTSNLILQKQNYALIAQQDEIIKQNNQIISLLETIANK